MSMKNARPRFGYEEGANTLYNYVTAQEIPIGPPLHADGGVWDTVKVAELILANKTIESAFTPEVAKVEQANVDFTNETPAVPENDKVEVANTDFDGIALNSASHPQSDSVEEAHDLKPESLETIEIDVEGTGLTAEERAQKESDKHAEEQAATE